MRGLLLAVALSVLAVACTVPEGREPGECSDGADNDVDGAFDCDDDDCSAAPSCDSAGGGGDGAPCEDYEYADYLADIAWVICQLWDQCGMLDDYDHIDDCLGVGQEPEPGDLVCEDFSCSLAQGCIEGWQAVSCEDLSQGVDVRDCRYLCSNF